MKGYFSQLALHTGLLFTEGHVKNRPVRPPTPLHVEEVTLVQAAESVTSVPTDGPITPEKIHAASAQTIQPSASVSETVPSEARVSSVDEGSESVPIVRDAFAIEQQSISTNQNAGVDQTASTPGDEADHLEQVEVQVVSPVPPTPGENSDQETKVDSDVPDLSDFDLSEPVERERMVRQYLREVQAWVAAGPTTEDNTTESESRNTEQPESVAFAVGRSPLMPSAQSASRELLTCTT